MPATVEPIKERVAPPVAGVDLEHALNYVAVDGIDLSWFYNCFTYPRVFYRKGSRPFLESLLEAPAATEMAQLRHCLAVLDLSISHFSRLGFRGPSDRGMSEEDLIRSGQGWCNEQARVLVALTQVVGLPSRLVFATMANGRGHVLTGNYFIH